MMSAARVTGVNVGRTTTSVTLVDVGDESDRFLTDVAIVAARETRGSLYGANVKRYPDERAALVSLYTD